MTNEIWKLQAQQTNENFTIRPALLCDFEQIAIFAFWWEGLLAHGVETTDTVLYAYSSRVLSGWLWIGTHHGKSNKHRYKPTVTLHFWEAHFQWLITTNSSTTINTTLLYLMHTKTVSTGAQSLQFQFTQICLEICVFFRKIFFEGLGVCTIKKTNQWWLFPHLKEPWGKVQQFPAFPACTFVCLFVSFK